MGGAFPRKTREKRGSKPVDLSLNYPGNEKYMKLNSDLCLIIIDIEIYAVLRPILFIPKPLVLSVNICIAVRPQMKTEFPVALKYGVNYKDSLMIWKLF